MRVSLYVRQRGTREQKKHNPKKSYPQDGSIIWVLRYGKAWETLDVKTLSEATMLRMRRQIELPIARRRSRSSATSGGLVEWSLSINCHRHLHSDAYALVPDSQRQQVHGLRR